eukprot:4404650-Pleurochrysis_carterae.AAC.1
MEWLSLCDAHPQARYSIDPDDDMEWVKAPSIDTYHLDSPGLLGAFISLHARGWERGACTACCSRARTACLLLTAQMRMQYTSCPRCVHGRTPCTAAAR